MAEIHLIGARSEDGNVSRRLLALARAFEDGVDLGHRGVHIREAAGQLDTLALELREQHSTLSAIPGPPPEVQLLLERLRKLADLAQKLVLLARSGGLS